jgi:hypothetical protein
MRNLAPYKRVTDNLKVIIDSYASLPSELKEKIAQTLARMASFKRQDFDFDMFKVLTDKLVAEGYLFLHTLDKAASGKIQYKVLYNARSSLGPLNSNYAPPKYESYVNLKYEKGRLVIEVPTVVPSTLSDIPAPLRVKKARHLPFPIRGTKPLTDE